MSGDGVVFLVTVMLAVIVVVAAVIIGRRMR